MAETAIGSGLVSSQRARMGRRAEPSNTRLWEIRAQRGLEASEVAVRADIPLRTYMRYEKGERSPTPANRKAIAEALQIEPKELFASMGSPVPPPIGALATSEGRFNINPEIVRNLLDAPENRHFLGLWIGLEEDERDALLEIMESFTRFSRSKKAS